MEKPEDKKLSNGQHVSEFVLEAILESANEELEERRKKLRAACNPAFYNPDCTDDRIAEAANDYLQAYNFCCGLNGMLDALSEAIDKELQRRKKNARKIEVTDKDEDEGEDVKVKVFAGKLSDLDPEMKDAINRIQDGDMRQGIEKLLSLLEDDED